MVVTLPTSHAFKSLLKVDLHGALYMSLSKFVTALTSHAEIEPCAKSAVVWLVQNSTSTASRLALVAKPVADAVCAIATSKPSSST